MEQFAVRFKTIELAQQFKDKFEEARAFVSESAKSSKSKTTDKEIKSTSTPSAAVTNETGAAAATTNHSGDDEDTGNDDDDDDDSSEEIRVLFEKQITLEERQGSQFMVCCHSYHSMCVTILDMSV